MELLQSCNIDIKRMKYDIIPILIPQMGIRQNALFT